MSDTIQGVPPCPNCGTAWSFGYSGADLWYSCGTVVRKWDGMPRQSDACRIIADMRPVVEAACKLRFDNTGTGGFALTRAVDAYRASYTHRDQSRRVEA